MDTSGAQRGRWLAVAGVALQTGLVLALIRLGPSLASFLSTLAVSGLGDPSSLGAAMREFFDAGVVGLAAGLVGLILLCVALVYYRYRAGWFVRFLTGYGVLLLLVFPVGTAFGVFFLAYCFRHRPEFSGLSA